VCSSDLQYHHGDRVGHVLPNGTCRTLMRHGSSCQRVVTQYMKTIIRHDECATRSAGLIGQCLAFEPLIESGFSARKRMGLVICFECGRSLQIH